MTPAVPVTVTYALTDLCMSLCETVRTLKAWAETHMDDVFAHRAEYDERTASGASRGVTRRRSRSA